MRPWFCIPTMSHYFQRLVKSYYLLLDFLKACQNVLIRKIRSLTFSFISTTLLDVLDKNKYEHNISYSGFLFFVLQFMLFVLVLIIHIVTLRQFYNVRYKRFVSKSTSHQLHIGIITFYYFQNLLWISLHLHVSRRKFCGEYVGLQWQRAK